MFAGCLEPGEREAAGLDVFAVNLELDAANKAFHAQGKHTALEAAEARYRNVLADAEHTLSPDNPKLLCAKANLGVALRLQGRYEEAEQQFQNTLEACEEGSEARFVCQLRMNLAMSLKEQDTKTDEIDERFSEAEADVERLIKQRILRKEDPIVLSFRQSYADFLLQIGDLAGEEMWLDVLDTKDRLFGAEDKRVLACKQALAESLSTVSVPKKEEDLPVDECGMRTKVEWNLSHIPANRAAGLMIEVKRVREQTHTGDDVVLVENTQVKLAEILMNEVYPPEFEEGETLLRTALERRVDRLGPGDKSVSDLHWVLGACLWRQGRLEEARQEFKTCWEVRRQVLGKDHPETVFAKRYYKRVQQHACCSVQ